MRNIENKLEIKFKIRKYKNMRQGKYSKKTDIKIERQ